MEVKIIVPKFPNGIAIGEERENLAVPVVVDYTAWVEQHGAGALQILLQRPQDADPYPVTVTNDNGEAVWTPNETDMNFKGRGEIQLVFTAGEVIERSPVIMVISGRSLVAAGDPPEPYEDWLQRLTELGAETQANAEAAQQSAENAAESAEDAAQSATSAESYAGQSETAAGLAQAAQTASEAARDAAQTAQASAESSATAASGSATAAAGSATAAAGSATSAAVSASDASESASAASDSATAAGDAETQAEAAKTAAQTAQSAAEDAQAAAEQAAQQAHVEYEQLSDAVDDLSDEVSQQKSAIEAHEQYAEETYAKQDGSYEDLTAGNAYELLSDRGDTNQQPYLFRQTGGDSSAYNREQLKKIVGGTVAWNQLACSYSNNGATLTEDGDTIKITPSVVGHRYVACKGANGYRPGILVTKEHVYLQSVVIKSDGTHDVGFQNYANPGSVNCSSKTNSAEWVCLREIAKATIDGNCYVQLASLSVSEYSIKKNSLTFFDLTQMFGTAIADYIYSLEQATAGAGVAFFRSLFPADYYDYNPGELISVEGVSAHETVGFNQWDEEWEPGAVNTSDGTERTTSNTIRSKNYCGLIGGSTYYATCGKTDGGNQNCYYIGIIFYDAEKRYISGGYFNNLTFTAPENARYFKLTTNTSTVVYGSTYNHDICINLSDTARNGTYEPYKKRTYPLDDSLTLRGIPKLDSNNRLYYDGDTYESDGTVTRRYGVVDLGTLTWGYRRSSGISIFEAAINGIKQLTSGSEIPNLVCVKYRAVTYNSSWVDGDMSAGALNSNLVDFVNNAYTDVASFKSAMSGVMLVYELATPTTETAEPYRELEICDRDGTEEFVSTSIVPVGHETFFPVNVFDYIDQKIAAAVAALS